MDWLDSIGKFLWGPSTPTPADHGAAPACAPPAAGEGGLAPEALSPEQRADRLQAQKELAGMFNIVPGGTKRERMPNEVTQEDFEKVARMYSDIRLGKSDLVLDDAGGAPFRDLAMKDIGRILQTESGRELVKELAYDPNPNNCEHKKTTLSLGKLRDAGTSVDPAALDKLGNGEGAATRIRYMPGGQYSADDVTYRADTILFHEMTHALHDKMGDRDMGKVSAREAKGPADVGESASEYQAVGLGDHAGFLTENFYRGERRDLMEDLPDRKSYNTR